MSDSHGNKDAMLKAVTLESPELILHLGDHDKDCDSIEWEYPEIPLRSVKGNCDRMSDNIEIDEFTLSGKRFFMTHGHLYNVKTGYTYVINSAASRGADILLFGHTHIPYYSKGENITIINPGSIGMGEKTYAILDFGNDDVICTIKKVPRRGLF
jgi:putative phosphoesterase